MTQGSLTLVLDEDEFQCRTERQPRHFWVDNEIADDYLPAIGVYGFAVYCLLARYSNNLGRSWPSINKLATKLKISKPTVRSALELLVENNLIAIQRRTETKENGQVINKSNVFSILDVKFKGVVNQVDQGGKPELPGVVNQVDSNNTYINKTQEKEDSNPDGLSNSEIQKPTVKSKKSKVAAAILPNGGHPSVTGVPVIQVAFEDLDVNSKRVALIETYYKSLPSDYTPSKKEFGGKNATLAAKWVDLGYTPTELALIVRDQFGCDEKGNLLEFPRNLKETFAVDTYRMKARLHGLDFAAIDAHWTPWLLTAKSHLSVNAPQSNQKVESLRDSKNALPEVAESEIDNTWALPDLADPIPEAFESRESETS